MKSSGFEVKGIDLDQLTGVYRKFGIPSEIRSCHTATVGDYFIEGHVPADAIKRLLAENPANVAGLALPGMPQGSPGMDGVKRGKFVVLQVNKDGSREEFGRF